jgi:NedA-like, galactose-binding domain
MNLVVVAMLAAAPVGAAQTVRVDSTPGHVANIFSPLRALGSSVDRVPSNATDAFFKPEAMAQILSAGWGAASYRQNTELFVQAWHWNPQGTWSDPSERGYFTGNATPGEVLIRHSYGYSLPRRGVTGNAGTEADGYSRLNDGDAGTFWKSNPYLSKVFTGEDDAVHPQWIVIVLDKKEYINAIKINWNEPYAKDYLVQYWTGDDAMDALWEPLAAEWITFPAGTMSDGNGGTTTLRLADKAAYTRSVRVLMTRSSNSATVPGPDDPRNRVGYAINEVYLGTIDEAGRFDDLVRHSPGQEQTKTYSSSTDCWHEPSDLYVVPDTMEAGDQPGLDLFYTSGITRGLPALIPVSMLYSTPEDAVAQIAYVQARGYPILGIELGEEAEGQYMLPEDYGALYIQWAAALHRLDPTLKLGLASLLGDRVYAWADAKGKREWLGRFIDYLKSHGRLSDFTFLPFEHYLYSGCQAPWEKLYVEPRALTALIGFWREQGVPADMPMYVTEINASGGDAALEIYGALFISDTFCGFLAAGGTAIFHYHTLPYSPAHPNCSNSWGTYRMFMVDKDYSLIQPTSQFYASQLLTQEWVEPKDADHRIFPTAVNIQDDKGNDLVTAYAVLRPDGQWSIMLVNKDHENEHPVRVVFHDDAAKIDRCFVGSVTMINYGKAQYQWHPAMRNGFADPDDPPAKTVLAAGPETIYSLPPASITVLRGRLVGDAGARAADARP